MRHAVILSSKKLKDAGPTRDYVGRVIPAQDFHGHDAKEPGVYNAGMSSEDEVRRVEHEWGEAFERKDLATLDRLMADDYILTDPLGNVRSKAESLAAIQTNEINFESTESDDVKVRINGDTAVVTGRSTFRGRYKGWSMAGQYQYTDVLVKRRGAWKAVGSHITALGTGPLRLRFGRLLCDWLF